MQAHQEEFAVALMCELFRVSRSGYYARLGRSFPSKRTLENQRLCVKIRAVFEANKGRYGSVRIRKALLESGETISRRRVCKLMKAQRLQSKHKRAFKITTDSKHDLPISPNLLNRQFNLTEPDKVYAADITYIPTHDGWLYWAVVMDLFSRKIVGWSMANRMKASLVNDALNMAIARRKPSKGLISHSDRGSQYASNNHRALLKAHGFKQSMSGKGNCWDNAVVESFFHSLKVELVHYESFHSREVAQQAIFEYIECYYNRIRMHSANDNVSPVEFEKLNYVS